MKILNALKKLSSDECVPMQSVIECINWILSSEKKHVGGRNFSAAFDYWGEEKLSELLENNLDMYKLRRSGNHLLQREKPITEKG